MRKSSEVIVTVRRPWRIVRDEMTVITLQEHEAHNREEVDKDDCEDEGEDYRSHIPCNRFDDIL